MRIYQTIFIFLTLYLNGVIDTYGQSIQDYINPLPEKYARLEQLLSDEKYEKVTAYCDSLILQNFDAETNGFSFLFKGQAAAEMSDNGSADFSFQAAIEQFRKAAYLPGLALAYARAGDISFLQNDYAVADSIYKISIKYALSAKLKNLLADIYQHRGNIATYNNQATVALGYLRQAFYLAGTTDDARQISIANELSTYFHADGQLDSAIYYFEQLRAIKQKRKDEEGLISDYCALGKLYGERGDYEKAQAHLIDALRMAEVQEDSFAMETIYLDIGDIYAAQSLWQSAEDYYRSALVLSQDQGSRFTFANSQDRLGRVFEERGEADQAIKHYEKALQAFRTINNRNKIAEALINLSRLYKENDHYPEAKTLLQEAINSRILSDDVFGLLDLKMSLAALEINQGNFQQGIQIAQSCLPKFQEMEDLDGQRQVYALLKEANEKTGNFKAAYRFQQRYHSISDSLTSVEIAQAIKEKDLLYSTEKKDKEIAQQNEMIKTQEVEILTKNNQLLLLAGGLLLAIMLTLLFVFIYWKNRQLNRQNMLMLKKEKEAQRLKAIIEGEEKERKRFSRELHDGLGAVLATVKMQISGIPRTLPEAQELPAYRKAEYLIDDACKTVREISHDLMPQVLEQQGLLFAIEDMCQSLSGQRAIEFDFIHFGEDQGLDNIVKITVYRIAQELLKNCIKHAEATSVIIQLTIEANEVVLIVEDNGKGFDRTKKPNGIGLDNIRSRVDYLNGELDVDSRIGEGSTFTIQIPLI
jgi:signal transduction histidine kinase/uncharacterized protein HemY